MATISAAPGIVIGGRPNTPRRRRPSWSGVTAGVRKGAPRAASLGRLGATLLAAAAVAAGLGAVRGAVGSPAVSSPITTRVESDAYPAWTVQPGDTLWAIASNSRPQTDPRATVLVLRELNDLGTDRPLQPGQVILLPMP